MHISKTWLNLVHVTFLEDDRMCQESSYIDKLERWFPFILQYSGEYGCIDSDYTAKFRHTLEGRHASPEWKYIHLTALPLVWTDE